MPDDFIELDGTELPRLAQHDASDQLPEEKPVQISLFLRDRAPVMARDQASGAAAVSEPIPLQSYAEEHGAQEEDLQAITQFADQYGFEIKDINEAGRFVNLEAPAGACNKAFGVKLNRLRDITGVHRGYEGQIQLPRELEDVVDGVEGLDDRSVLPRIESEHAPFRDPRGEPSVDSKLYEAKELAGLYDFPQDLTGAGQTIGIFSVDGGYRQQDLDAYFHSIGMAIPSISTVNIGYTPRRKSQPSPADIEATMDLQIAGSFAPGAKLVLYRVSSSNPVPYLSALKTAIFDQTHRPNILSVSYGATERIFKRQSIVMFEEACVEAASMGITICVASGDEGSATHYYNQFPPPLTTHVNFPACCPTVLACGGTTLRSNGNQVASETVWNDLNQCRAASAGGISVIFPQPAYQANVPVPENATPGQEFRGRGIPDVACNADYRVGIRMLYNGQEMPGGGTSASAPIWAALIARMNEGLGTSLGHVNPLLYRLAGGTGFRQITEGFNGAYQAGKVWNPCTGLGSPNGTALLTGLRQLIGSSTSDQPCDAATSAAEAAAAAQNFAQQAMDAASRIVK